MVPTTQEDRDIDEIIAGVAGTLHELADFRRDLAQAQGTLNLVLNGVPGGTMDKTLESISVSMQELSTRAASLQIKLTENEIILTKAARIAQHSNRLLRTRLKSTLIALAVAGVAAVLAVGYIASSALVGNTNTRKELFTNCSISQQRLHDTNQLYEALAKANLGPGGQRAVTAAYTHYLAISPPWNPASCDKYR